MIKRCLKILSIVSVLLVGAFSASAVRPPIPEISVSPQSVSFSAGGGSKSVTVTAKNMNWSIVTAPAAWVTVTKSANGVQIRASKNSSTSSRSTSITLGQGKTTCKVTITQKGAPAPKPTPPQNTPPKPTLQVSEDDIVADSQGEDRYLKVDANGANWNVISYPDSWVGISGKTADGLRLKIEKNLNLTERTTSLTIGNNKDRREITIRQEAGYQFIVKNTELTADYSGEELTVNVDARNFNWNVIDYPAEWVAVVGKTDSQLRLKIDPNQSENSRSTTLIIGNSKKKNTISIMQNGNIEIFDVNGVRFEMVRVDGGSFMMGSNDSEAYDNEQPVHRETVSTFYIGRTEVTQALWEAVMGRKWDYFKGANLPVEWVSWNECEVFIHKLNQLTGRNFRLPTEAEWEYAARGGSRSQGYKYSGSNDLDCVGWYKENSGGKLHPVATKQANELGLYDMSSNVPEWTSDRWSSNYDSHRNGGSNDLVFRGGSWDDIARCCRSGYRFHDIPNARFGHLGFRLAF